MAPNTARDVAVDRAVRNIPTTPLAHSGISGDAGIRSSRMGQWLSSAATERLNGLLLLETTMAHNIEKLIGLALWGSMRYAQHAFIIMQLPCWSAGECGWEVINV